MQSTYTLSTIVADKLANANMTTDGSPALEARPYRYHVQAMPPLDEPPISARPPSDCTAATYHYRHWLNHRFSNYRKLLGRLFRIRAISMPHQ